MTRIKGKKSLDEKAAQKFVIHSRANGKSDQDIYNELSQQYYDKKTLAYLIARTVTAEKKKKYKIHNNVLIGLVVLEVLLRIINVSRLAIQTEQLWALLLVLVLPFFTLYFAYEIAQYNASIYRYGVTMSIFRFTEVVNQLKQDTTDIIIYLVYLVAIIGLSLYLGKKLLPDYLHKDLKKDINGEYILG